jgi:hypothetical protein
LGSEYKYSAAESIDEGEADGIRQRIGRPERWGKWTTGRHGTTVDAETDQRADPGASRIGGQSAPSTAIESDRRRRIEQRLIDASTVEVESVAADDVGAQSAPPSGRACLPESRPGEDEVYEGKNEIASHFGKIEEIVAGHRPRAVQTNQIGTPVKHAQSLKRSSA